MNNSVNKLVLQAKGLYKQFGDASDAVSVLRGVDLDLASGEMLAIVGASGSGKSTLLHVLGALDAADQGELTVNGEDPSKMSERRRGELRNKHIGFVYQFHHLLGEFTAQENVAMPLWIRRVSKADAMMQAAAILDKVGLGHRLDHAPAQLSGGERQRVAFARAMVTNPSCVLADEPTGNLDRDTAKQVFELVRAACKERGTAFVVVTHDLSLAARADRVLSMQDGRLVPFDLTAHGAH